MISFSVNKGDLTKLIRHHIEQCERYGVKIVLNTEVDKALIEDVKPDAVVLAMGAESYNPLEKTAKELVSEVYVIGDAKKAGRIVRCVPINPLEHRSTFNLFF
ncbi:MAG: hypothetical protein GX777_09330 [Fastidiosipila sp.]|nr:hypothetical protein [Fastidiosipila sp.]